jgi:hypothetical protein
MRETVFDVLNAKVHPGSSGQAIRCTFQIAEPPPGPRSPSQSLCTLTMLRADAEQLLEQLQAALDPPKPLSNLN